VNYRDIAGDFMYVPSFFDPNQSQYNPANLTLSIASQLEGIPGSIEGKPSLLLKNIPVYTALVQPAAWGDAAWFVLAVRLRN
jgi:hypothetical protein